MYTISFACVRTKSSLRTTERVGEAKRRCKGRCRHSSVLVFQKERMSHDFTLLSNLHSAWCLWFCNQRLFVLFSTLLLHWCESCLEMFTIVMSGDSKATINTFSFSFSVVILKDMLADRRVVTKLSVASVIENLEKRTDLQLILLSSRNATRVLSQTR